jgi:hypothetical protein
MYDKLNHYNRTKLHRGACMYDKLNHYQRTKLLLTSYHTVHRLRTTVAQREWFYPKNADEAAVMRNDNR